MTGEERKIALYCLKANSDYHSEVCEECIKYPNCDHTGQDDVTETIIKALEQEPKKGQWIRISPAKIYECSECSQNVMTSDICSYKFCHGCGAKMESEE